MSTYTFDPLTERCKVCDRLVKVIDYWGPFGRGIRHSSCTAECRGCGDRIRPGDEFFSEMNDPFCEDCFESLTVDVPPDGEWDE